MISLVRWPKLARFFFLLLALCIHVELSLDKLVWQAAWHPNMSSQSSATASAHHATSHVSVGAVVQYSFAYVLKGWQKLQRPCHNFPRLLWVTHILLSMQAGEQIQQVRGDPVLTQSHQLRPNTSLTLSSPMSIMSPPLLCHQVLRR